MGMCLIVAFVYAATQSTRLLSDLGLCVTLGGNTVNAVGTAGGARHINVAPAPA